MDLRGQCLCGGIAYTAAAEPAFTVVCHCKACQRQAGSAFATLIAVPKDAVAVSGTMQTFTHAGGSGKPVRRRFCPACGSPILVEVEALPGLALIAAGSLDDTHAVRPTMNIFCDAAQPWVPMAPDTRNFPGRPG